MKTLITLLFCATFAIGQVNYPLPTVSLVDNTTYARSNNVWHLMSGSPALASMTHGIDSSGVPIHYGVTPAGQVWEFMDTFAPKSYNPGTWVQVPAFGTAIKQMAFGPNSLTYSLQAYAACPSGFYGIFLWNGSVWTRPGTGCVSQLSAAQDGTLVGVGTTTYLYISSNNSTTWAQVTNAGTGWKSVSVSSAHLAYATKPNGTIYSVDLSAGAPYLFTGLTNAPVATDAAGDAYVVGTDSYVYFLNTATGVWNKVLGSGFASVGMCGSMCIYAIDSSGNAYQFPDKAVQHTQPISGSAPCNGCRTETVYANLHVVGTTKHYGGGAVNQGIAGGSSFGFSTPADMIFDPFDCMTTGDNQCSDDLTPAYVSNDDLHSDVFYAAGVNYGPIWMGLAQVTLQKIGAAYNCNETKDGKLWCTYPTAVSCPNPGPYAFVEATARALKEDGDLDWGWTAHTVCLGFDYGTGKGYTCLPVSLNLGTSANPELYCDTQQDILNQIP